MENELKALYEAWVEMRDRHRLPSFWEAFQAGFSAKCGYDLAQSGREGDAAPREFMTHADEALWSIGEPSIKLTKSGANEQIGPVCKESFHTDHVVEVNDMVDPVRDELIEMLEAAAYALRQNNAPTIAKACESIVIKARAARP